MARWTIIWLRGMFIIIAVGEGLATVLSPLAGRDREALLHGAFAVLALILFLRIRVPPQEGCP